MDAAGLDRFALMGMSGGAPVAVSYAAAHPERVTRLVLHGSAVVGCFGETADDEAEEAFQAMIRAGWARPDSLFRRMFTNIFIPNATEEQMVWMDELVVLAPRRRRGCIAAVVANGLILDISRRRSFIGGSPRRVLVVA